MTINEKAEPTIQDVLDSFCPLRRDLQAVLAQNERTHDLILAAVIIFGALYLFKK